MSNSNDQNRPNSLANIIDHKALILETVGLALSAAKSGTIEGLSLSDLDSRVLLFTNFGTLECDVDVQDSVVNRAITEVVNMAVNKKEEEVGEGNVQFVNISGRITLKDVKLVTFNHPKNVSHLSEITLFSDQIVGFSFGRINDHPA